MPSLPGIPATQIGQQITESRKDLLGRRQLALDRAKNKNDLLLAIAQTAIGGADKAGNFLQDVGALPSAKYETAKALEEQRAANAILVAQIRAGANADKLPSGTQDLVRTKLEKANPLFESEYARGNLTGSQYEERAKEEGKSLVPSPYLSAIKLLSKIERGVDETGKPQRPTAPDLNIANIARMGLGQYGGDISGVFADPHWQSANVQTQMDAVKELERRRLMAEIGGGQAPSRIGPDFIQGYFGSLSSLPETLPGPQIQGPIGAMGPAPAYTAPTTVPNPEFQKRQAQKKALLLYSQLLGQP